MISDETNQATAIALDALAWVLADPRRAERLLALTGLTPMDLRDRVEEPATLAAVLGFLEAHEPDLIACAEATGHEPATLVAMKRRLEA